MLSVNLKNVKDVDVKIWVSVVITITSLGYAKDITYFQ